VAPRSNPAVPSGQQTLEDTLNRKRKQLPAEVIEVSDNSSESELDQYVLSFVFASCDALIDLRIGGLTSIETIPLTVVLLQRIEFSHLHPSSEPEVLLLPLRLALLKVPLVTVKGVFFSYLSFACHNRYQFATFATGYPYSCPSQEAGQGFNCVTPVSSVRHPLSASSKFLL
jgi:hypothetical protein